MGHEADVIDLVELDMPMFTVARSKELDTIPGMSELKAAMSGADSWMVIAPEYNGSMPPTLNNAVAWLSTEWQDFRALFNRRKVGLATLRGGGGAHVIIAMRQMFSFLGCIVLGRNCVSNKNKEANPETIEDKDQLVSKLNRPIWIPTAITTLDATTISTLSSIEAEFVSLNK